MCDIKDWLIEHPAISIRYMEKSLGLPIGIVRVRSEKPIPSKYRHSILLFLKEYGMINDCVSKRKEYFFRNNHIVTKEDGLFRKKDIGENTPLYIE